MTTKKQPAKRKPFDVRQSEYYLLATDLLGRDPEFGMMPVITLANVDDPLPYNVADLSDEDDQQLCAIVCSRTPGMDASTWEFLSESERLGWMRIAVQPGATTTPQPAESAKRKQVKTPVDEWADFRNGPGGVLLTVNVCKKRFKVTGKDLSTNDEAKASRRKNPQGRGYVYRYDVVSRLANRKD